MGPLSIIKLSPNWACQMGPFYFINFLLSGQLPFASGKLQIPVVVYVLCDFTTNIMITELFTIRFA